MVDEMKAGNEQAPTTVRLTQRAVMIKEEQAPIYGLKNILSAGLVLFEELSDEEQKRAIVEALVIERQAKGDSSAEGFGPFFDVVGEMLEADRSGVRVLSKEQQKAAKSFRKAFAPTAEEIVDGAVGDVKAGKQTSPRKKPKTG